VPALPGCASQGDTMDELMANIKEAIEGWRDAPLPAPR
jgi:predicted RNase H-like HicB family nuclease